MARAQKRKHVISRLCARRARWRGRVDGRSRTTRTAGAPQSESDRIEPDSMRIIIAPPATESGDVWADRAIPCP